MDIKEYKTKGKKHHKNKVRYKNKSKISASEQLEHLKPKIDLKSNWDRYEPLGDDAGADYAITDFSLLANAPSSIGSHFQFKSDKNALSCDENFVQNGLFTLDLDLLDMSLNTIPFNVRYKVTNEIFTKDEIKLMQKKAEEATKVYNFFLLNVKGEKPEFETSGYTTLNSTKMLHLNLPLVSPDISSSTEREEHNIDAIETAIEKEPNINLPLQKNNNLEQWLDEFLDD